MASPEDLARLRDVHAWNAWRNSNSGVKLDLKGEDFSGWELGRANLGNVDLARAIFVEADLAGANLSSANLAGACLGCVNLSQADLREADLTNSDFGEANLFEANLVGANLSGAFFGDANLMWANLSWTQLRGTNFRWASFDSTTLGNVDLSQAEGLDEISHRGPSTIGVDTIYRSKGRIPEIFLRGAGVPDIFIANMKSLVAAMDPIQFYSCFISHSTKDQAFADRLHADLQDKGVRCWFAPHDIKGGKMIHEQIDEAIRVYDRLLLILSEHSMNSRWVKTEIAHARQKEQIEKRHVLFPIGLVPFEKIRVWKLFDADIGDDSAREVRSYFIPDFSGWNDHESYQKTFKQLLRDLKAGASAKSERPGGVS